MSLRVLWCLPCLLLAACPADDDRPADTTPDATETEVETTPDVEPDTAPETTPDVTVDSEVETTPEVTPDTETTEEVGPQTCAPLTLTGLLVPGDAFGTFTLGGDIDLGLGGPLPDAVVFEFYTDETGDIDLGANGNENYVSCDQCVRFVQDIDASGAVKAKNFFQKSGTLTIDPTTPPDGIEIKLTLTNVEMIEVLIRAEDLQTFPVEDGACYQNDAPIMLETGECVPVCGDHTCGSDGCGGTCGGCGDGASCNLDGKTCEAPLSCLQVALDGPLDNIGAGVYRLDLSELGFGAPGRSDFLQVEFYADDTGLFDLGSSTNRNYATCKQCVRAVFDGGTELFQRSGQLSVSDASTPRGEPGVDGFVALDLSGLVLEQVIIDDEFNSSAIAGGFCIEITTGALSSE